MSNARRFVGPVLLVLILAVVGLGIASQVPRDEAPRATPVETAAKAPAAVLKVADVKQVCMVNNQFMGKDQIPVEVEGKTYYGCCEMCKEKLAKDPAARYSADPVSGARVDKATAVIGVRADGTALYFESEASLEEYASRPQP